MSVFSNSLDLRTLLLQQICSSASKGPRNAINVATLKLSLVRKATIIYMVTAPFQLPLPSCDGPWPTSMGSIAICRNDKNEMKKWQPRQFPNSKLQTHKMFQWQTNLQHSESEQGKGCNMCKLIITSRIQSGRKNWVWKSYLHLPKHGNGGMLTQHTFRTQLLRSQC